MLPLLFAAADGGIVADPLHQFQVPQKAFEGLQFPGPSWKPIIKWPIICRVLKKVERNFHGLPFTGELKLLRGSNAEPRSIPLVLRSVGIIEGAPYGIFSWIDF